VAGWEDGAREQFLDLQFRAQRLGWAARFPDAEHELILLDRRPVGRLCIAWSQDECRVVDVALLPAYRELGLGAHVFGEVVAEADCRGIPVRTTVDRTNQPSIAFHARLGFEIVEEDAAHLAFERPVSRVRPRR
jgi:ribosomal protein S18 acetylase RimI-like enzyme